LTPNFTQIGWASFCCLDKSFPFSKILIFSKAKPLVQNISKFDFDILSQVVIKCASDDDYIMSFTKVTTKAYRQQKIGRRRLAARQKIARFTKQKQHSHCQS
jgi:hypothetical protein